MKTAATELTGNSAIGELVEEIFSQIEAGRTIDVEHLARDYPEYRQRLDGMVQMLKDFQTLDSSINPRGESIGDLETAGCDTLGDFRLLRQIGRGGMGVVYEAQQLSIDRRVALKILPLAALVDVRALQRFKNEVAAIATLEHPHIVSVYLIGEERGIHYYSMQLVRGQSLAVVIRTLQARADSGESIDGESISQVISCPEQQTDASKQQQNPGTDSLSNRTIRESTSMAASETTPRLSQATTSRSMNQTYFSNVARLMIQAAGALDHAHRYGIVHRDLKPGNLLLDQDGRLFVSDFGLARIETEPGLTATGELIGTFRYMSPEQMTGDPGLIDRRTDIYSLGATMYEMVCLQPMFRGSDREALIERICSEEPVPVRRINPAVPLDLATIIHKASRKNPDERYDSFGELANDLQRFLDCRPISAKPPTLANRIVKWGRRNPYLVAMGVLGLVLATIGLVISNVLILRQKSIADLKTLEAGRLEILAEERAETEREARLHAEELLDQTGQYNEFLRGIFNNLDPRTRSPDDPPLENMLAERLIKAGNQIGGGNYANPGYQVTLLVDLGNTLIALGFPDDALQLFQRAEEIVVDKSADTETSWLAYTSNGLGRTFVAVGKPELAVPAYQRAYDFYHRRDGDSKNALSCLHGMAVGQLALGQYQESIRNLELVVSQRSEVYGETHRATMTSMSVLATAYQRSGQLEKSLQWMDRVLDLRRTTLGDQSVHTNTTRSNMATLLLAMGNDHRAAELLQEAVAAMTVLLGDTHPNTNVMQTNLATALQNQGKHSEAMALVETAEANLKQRHRADHPYVIKSQIVKAGLLLDRNQVSEALMILNSCYETVCAAHGEANPAALDIGVRMARALSLDGQFEEACQLAATMLEQAEDQLGPIHSTTRQALLVTARNQLLMGDYPGALEILASSFDLSENQNASPDRDQILLSSELGFVHLLVGNYQEGAQMLETLVVDCHDRFDETHPLMHQLWADLALAHTLMKQPEKAQQILDLIHAQEANDPLSKAILFRRWLQQALIQIQTGQFDAISDHIAGDIDRIAEYSGQLNASIRLPLRFIASQLESAVSDSENDAGFEELRSSLNLLIQDLK